MMEWNSELYLRYERERTQPSLDLVSRISLESPGEIVARNPQEKSSRRQEIRSGLKSVSRRSAGVPE